MAPPRVSLFKLILALGLMWVILIGGGWYAFQVYQLSPGPSRAAVQHWPERAPFGLDERHPTLVLVAHPDCPCTRASLEELTRIIARAGTRVVTHILIYSDPKFDAAWRDAGWQQAGTVPGATLHVDPLGRSARALGLQTSGHVLLFAPDGRRLFSGGITRARGERGDSVGGDTVARLLLADDAAGVAPPLAHALPSAAATAAAADEHAAHAAHAAPASSAAGETAPVFGCLLWAEDERHEHQGAP